MLEKLWANLHGGSTHFPIAMMIASFLFDFAAYVWNREPLKRDLHSAGFFALLLGAAATFVSVLSGLAISAWRFFGSGTLAKHHDFVWPAFGLMIALAVWRVVVRNDAARPAFGVYLAFAALTAALMGAAGYWGGELIGS